MDFGLDIRFAYPTSCTTLRNGFHSNKRDPDLPMWPVQTLTLLLCLTDEEQLFAQQQQIRDPQVPAIEATVTDEAPALPAGTLALFGEC